MLSSINRKENWFTKRWMLPFGIGLYLPDEHLEFAMGLKRD
jgi:hypothetical protein